MKAKQAEWDGCFTIEHPQQFCYSLKCVSGDVAEVDDWIEFIKYSTYGALKNGYIKLDNLYNKEKQNSMRLEDMLKQVRLPPPLFRCRPEAAPPRVLVASDREHCRWPCRRSSSACSKWSRAAAAAGRVPVRAQAWL